MIPPEVFTIIKTYLSLTDIAALVLTCKAINDWVGMNSTIREYYLILSDIDDDDLFCDACRDGYLNLVMYLSSIGRGVDDGIILASKYGHLPVVKFLYSVGCNPRALNDYAIIRASSSGHLPVVEFLYSVGCDLRVDEDGEIN